MNSILTLFLQLKFLLETHINRKIVYIFERLSLNTKFNLIYQSMIEVRLNMHFAAKFSLNVEIPDVMASQFVANPFHILGLML